MDSKESKNLFQRLAEVRKVAPYLKKEKSGSQYSYVGSSDVLGVLHEAINNNGLLLIPSIVGHNIMQKNETFAKNGQEKTRTTYFTEIEMNMRWQNIDDANEYIDCKWYAQGVDIEGEKGVGKALTYGEKYFLLKFFNIATDKDDPDSFQKRQETKLPPKLIDEEQVGDLTSIAERVAKLSNVDSEKVTGALCKKMKIGSIEELEQRFFGSAKTVLLNWENERLLKREKAKSTQQKNIDWGK